LSSAIRLRPRRLVGHGFRPASDPYLRGIHRRPQIVIALQIHPKFAARRKITPQPKRGVGANAARLVHDRADARGRDAKGKREAINTDSRGAHEFFEQSLAGMNRGRYKLPCHDVSSSVISASLAFPPDLY
jgi:hypothetical protein